LLRSIRGGAYQYVPAMVTSAARERADPDHNYFSMGFRIARTLPGSAAGAAPQATPPAATPAAAGN
jgi:hypothetical protein